MKQLLLLFLIFTVSFAAVSRKAVCIIDQAYAYNKVGGRIDISYDASLNSTSFNVTITNTTGLVATNGFHVHQIGVDGKSASCGDAAKHYNPLLNYGEIADRSGKIPLSGTVSLTSDWLAFEGEYSILGRSLIVHDNTTLRLGCCTVKLIEDGTGGTTANGYSQSVLKARLAGVNITFFEILGVVSINISTSSALTDASNNFNVRTTAECNSSILYNGSQSFSNAVVTDFTIALTGITNLGNFAGRALVRTPVGGGTEECGVILQYGTQPNGPYNDFYNSTQAATTMTATTMTATTMTATTSASASTSASTSATTPAPSGNAITWAVSLLFLIAFILIQ